MVYLFTVVMTIYRREFQYELRQLRQ